MKKIYMMMLALAVSLAAMAQSGLGTNHRVIGHTQSDEIEISGAAFGQAGTYSLGATLDPSNLSLYAGCRIVGIRVAAALDLGRTRMFLKDEAGNTLAEPKQRLYEGWNNVYFNGDGIELTGEETLFYGFDYVETAEMVSAKKGGVCCMRSSTDGGFLMEDGGNLYPVTGVGDLCVQLIVDVSGLPEFNLAVTHLDTGFKYKSRTEEIDMFMMLTNVGRSDINTFTLAVEFDGQAPTTHAVEKDIASGATDTYEIYVPIPGNLEPGKHEVRAYIVDANGEAVAGGPDNGLSSTFVLYDNYTHREKAYLEIYSDASNSYSSLLDDLIVDLKESMGDKIAISKVARPQTDLSTGDSDYLFDLYAYTTPTFTINRSYFPGERNIAYDLNDYFGLLPNDMLVSILEDMIYQDYESVSFAGIGVSGVYNEDTRELKIDVSGETLPEIESIYGKMALTVMLTEDDVKSKQTVITSSGRESVDRNYLHSDVLRTYITSPLGKEVNVNGNRYSETLTYTVPETFDPSKLKVVAILTKAADAVTSANVYDMDVINCADWEVKGQTGVDSIADDTQAERILDGIYLPNGVEVPVGELDNLATGVYIMHYSDGTTRKVVK